MFITFEGGEGAGKSTLSRRVCAELKKTHEVVPTREPGGTPFGEEVRSLLLHHRRGVEVGAKAELFLFLAARAQHVQELILPAIKQGKIVLCDRFSDSTIAYQGAGRALGVDFVRQACAFATGNLQPDLTFFVDIDPQVGLTRVGKRSDTKDRIEDETIAFHERVRQAFFELAKDPKRNIVILDGSLSEEMLFQQAMQHIGKLL